MPSRPVVQHTYFTLLELQALLQTQNQNNGMPVNVTISCTKSYNETILILLQDERRKTSDMQAAIGTTIQFIIAAGW
jgi:hypothetical protein